MFPRLADGPSPMCWGPKRPHVVSICNHCPWVKASIDHIISESATLAAIGIATIAIMRNDITTYRDDSLENMKLIAAAHGFTSPYVIDETQDVARTCSAQRTQSLNARKELQYRGRLHASRGTGFRRPSRPFEVSSKRRGEARLRKFPPWAVRSNGRVGTPREVISALTIV
jgi:hypothetical protein